MKDKFEEIEESFEERNERLENALQKSEEMRAADEDISLDYFHSRVYVKNMKWYRKCKSSVAFQLLCYFLEHADARTGRVLFPASRRQEFVRLCGVSNQSVTNALNELRDFCVIFQYMENIPGPNNEKTGEVFCPSGMYWLNPKMFWLGSENSRRHAYLVIREFYPNI